MELKFIVGILLVSLGFVLMATTDEPLEGNDNALKNYVSSPVKNLHREPTTARGYARQMVSAKEYKALEELIMLESSWNSEAQNKRSTAYGLGQFVDKTWDLVGDVVHGVGWVHGVFVKMVGIAALNCSRTKTNAGEMLVACDHGTDASRSNWRDLRCPSTRTTDSYTTITEISPEIGSAVNWIVRHSLVSVSTIVLVVDDIRMAS